MFKQVQLLIFFLLFQSSLLAQIFCNDFGNVIIYSNYDGGVLNIDIDENIPNLKVGICSYEAVEVNFSGVYVNNIMEVIYAGFGNPNNTVCGGATIPQVAINGVPPNIVRLYTGSNGNSAISPYLSNETVDTIPLINCIVSGEGCLDNTNNSGGGNSSPQIVQFFLAELGASATLYYHYTQYGCFSGVHQISDGGNCCLITPTSSPNPIYTGGSSYNFMPDNVSLCNGAVTIDLSAYPLLVQQPFFTGYVWNDGQTGHIATFNQAGTYWFTATDYCHSDSYYLSDTIEILPCSCFAATATLNALTCNNQNNGSIAIDIVPSGSYSYVWNTIPVQNTATASNLGVGAYSVTITDNNTPCDTIITANITAPPNIFNAELTQSAYSTCVYDTVSISYEGNTADLSAYNWFFSGVTQGNGNGFSVSVASNQADTAIVLFVATSALSGCTDTLTAPIIFNNCGCIYPCDDNDCTTSNITDPLTCACSFPPIICNDNDCSTTDVFDTTICACAFNPIMCNDNNEATSDSFDTLNCKCQYRILPTPRPFIVPTAFSPNDDGINDLFGMFINENKVTLLQFSVYNRWGQRLFYTTQANDYWNGDYQNKAQDMGVYIYSMIYTDANNIMQTYNGNFMLIR